eukprot:8839097-Ditylum_brightwellii.AAC.1
MSSKVKTLYIHTSHDNITSALPIILTPAFITDSTNKKGDTDKIMVQEDGKEKGIDEAREMKEFKTI